MTITHLAPPNAPSTQLPSNHCGAPARKVDQIKGEFAGKIKALVPNSRLAQEVVTCLTRVDGHMASLGIMVSLFKCGSSDRSRLARQVFGEESRQHRHRVHVKLNLFVSADLVRHDPAGKGDYTLWPAGEKVARVCREFLADLEDGVQAEMQKLQNVTSAIYRFKRCGGVSKVNFWNAFQKLTFETRGGD